MHGHSLALGALAFLLAACGSDGDRDTAQTDPPAPGAPLAGATAVTVPLSLETDLTTQTIAKATCTRGNSFARLTVDPQGRASGTLTDTEAPIGGTMIARDAKTVYLTVDRGAVRNETVGEAMQITTDGQRVMLTGTTFICRGVEVRPG